MELKRCYVCDAILPRNHEKIVCSLECGEFPLKRCEECRKVIKRHRIGETSNGYLMEGKKVYEKRKYCGKTCMGKASRGPRERTGKYAATEIVVPGLEWLRRAWK